MTVFNRETKVLGDRYRMVEQTSWAAGVAGLLLLFVAVLATGSLNRNVKAVLILSSTFLSAGGAIVATELSNDKRELYEGLKKAQRELVKRQAESVYVQEEFKLRAIAIEELVAIVARLPEQRQAYHLQQAGLSNVQVRQVQQYIQGNQQPTITVPSQVVPTRAQSGTRSIQQVDLGEWKESKKVVVDAGALYAKGQRQHMIFTGNQGEGKTAACHYALHQWAIADPDLMVYAFDPHYGKGRDPRFVSNWLGVPYLQEMPENPQTCVFKGRGKDLLPFLQQVADLFEYRLKTNEDKPDVVIVIDEFTNLLETLDNSVIKEINTCLATFATESPKYGIFLWLVVHTLTLEELGISRKILRQCHICMGAEMSQDKVQVSNSPRSLPKDSVTYAQNIYRSCGKPAGFVSSLPVENGYLPVPPIGDLRELLLDWGEGQQVEIPESVRPDLSTVDPDVDPYEAIAIVWRNAGGLSLDDIKELWWNLRKMRLNDEGAAKVKDIVLKKLESL